MQQTIPVNDRSISSHVGSTPSTGPFTVDFPFFSLADVIVTRQDDGHSGIAVLVRGADYTLDGVATEDGSFSSGTVNLVLPVANATITRYGDTVIERLSNFPLQGFFSRLALNAELNRVTVVLQEFDREFSDFSQLSLHIPDFEFGKVTLAAPAELRSGKVLAWDNDGNLTTSNQTLGEIENPTAIIVSGTGYVANLAALKALPAGSQPPFVEMLGYATAGDGGGGVFVRRAGSALVANDVTVVTCTATPADRYVRQYESSINVRWAGGIGDGIVDDTVAINRAIAAAPQGGIIFLPTGTWRTTAPLVIDSKNGVRLVGAAPHATSIVTSAAAGHVIVMTFNSSCSVEEVRIVASVVKDANTAAIYADNNHNCTVRHVVIGAGTDHNLYAGIQVEAGTSQYMFKIHDFEINGGRYGIIVGANITAPAVRVQDLWVIDGNITSCSEDGMLLINVTGFYFTRVSIGVCRNGLRTFPAAGGAQVSAGMMHSVICDTCTEYGFKLITNGGFMSGNTFIQCWACGCGSTVDHNGILVDGGTGNVGVFRFNAVNVQANSGSGIVLDHCVDVQICDSIVACNSQAQNNGKAGIEARGSAHEWHVHGGSCNGYGISSVQKQAFGIFIWPGSTFYVIEGCNVGNNLTMGIVDNAGHLARRISHNPGFNNKNYGTSSITAATSVVVAHGLHVTPDRPQFDIRPSQDPGVDIRWWVSAADGMNFTLSTNAAASFAFGWSVATYGA